MSHKYMDAFNKDVERLLKELKTLNSALKKNPSDTASKAKLDKMRPFLTEDALKKRQEVAAKLDSKDTGKIVKECGLPGW